jgi:hypothetical protein
MRRLLLFVIAGGMLAIPPSCTEDEFLEPVKVALEIKMAHNEPFDDRDDDDKSLSLDDTMEDELEFISGKLHLSAIEFGGERENNDSHYFSRSFSDRLVADLEEETLNQPVSFDIPQGSYKSIRLTLHTNKTDTCCGLVFRGMYEPEMDGSGQIGPPPFEEIPVELSFFNHEESIPLTLKTETGEQQIVFKDDQWDTLEITIDLAHMFKFINPGRLRQAEIHGTGKRKKIIISSQHNQKLYYSLVERVERSMKAVIK